MSVSKVIEPQKSSAEILTELFSSFNAEPPNLDDTPSKKHKKSKKKHKHKAKKHKKKSKYKYSSSDSTDDESSELESSHKRKMKKRNKDYEYLKQLSEINLKSIKREPTNEAELAKEVSDLSNTVLDIKDIEQLIKQEKKQNENVHDTENNKEIFQQIYDDTVQDKINDTRQESDKSFNKITIKNLKNSSVYEATIKEIEEKAAKFEEGELTGSENENDDILDNLTPEISPTRHDVSDRYEKKRKYNHGDKCKKNDCEDSKWLKKDRQRSRSRDREHRSNRKDIHYSHSHQYKDSSDRDKYKTKENEKIKSRSHDRSRSKDRDKHKSKIRDVSRSKDQEKRKSRSKSRERNRRRSKSREKSKSRDRDKKSLKSKDRSRSRERDKRTSKSKDRSKSRDRIKRRSRSRERDKRKSRSKDRSRSSRDHSNHRSDRKRRSKTPTSSIDKKKLLEIARKNAINMLKSGTLPEALTLGPQAQEKVIAAIKSGGKTIEELTEFCRNLSQKEALGELSSVSSNEDEMDSTGENGKAFHHPFQLKEKPLSIIMNIKNATALPLKTAKEKSAELRLQFPVSSGQHHRKTESEWVPVSPKATETAVVPVASVPIVLPPSLPKPVIEEPVQEMETMPATNTQVDVSSLSLVDISSIVSQRLSAMRKLQENPHDTYAMTQISEASKQMQTWAQSKLQPGQFTGSTGAQVLSAAELSSGYQAWAKKVRSFSLAAWMQAQTISQCLEMDSVAVKQSE